MLGSVLTTGAATSGTNTIGAAASHPILLFRGRAHHRGVALMPMRPYKLGIAWPLCYILPKKDK